MNNYFLNDKIILDQNQEAVLESPPNLIVTGTAGTGKTLLAIKIAIKYAELNEKVAIIVYTKSLRTYIEDFISLKTKNKVNVFYEWEWDNKNLDLFDIIIIDEIQDFSISDVNKIMKYSRKGIYLFGDLEQKLYNKTLKHESTLDAGNLKTLHDFKTINLSVNYRIPRQIVAFINNVYKYVESPQNALGMSTSQLIQSSYPKKNLNSFSNESDKPQLIHLMDYTDELSWIVDFLNSDHGYKNVGILLKRNSQKKNGYFFTKKIRKEILPGVQETYDYLCERGIEAGYKLRSLDNLHFKSECNFNVMTTHSAKGLEFDCLILPFYSKSNLNENYNIPYIAFTRCSKKLIITYSGIISEDLQFMPNVLILGNIRRPASNDAMHPAYFLLPEYKSKFEEVIKDLDNFSYDFR